MEALVFVAALDYDAVYVADFVDVDATDNVFFVVVVTATVVAANDVNAE